MEELSFGPKNVEEHIIFLIVQVRIEAQVKLHELMIAKGVNNEQLADKMNVDKAVVDMLLCDDGGDLSLRMWSQAFAALDQELTLGLRESIFKP